MSRRFRRWSRFSSWALSLPLRMKIMGIVLGVLFMLASVVTLQVLATMKVMMREELRQRGISVARDVAERAANLILTDNLFAANELVKDRMESDRDVRHVLIVDHSGSVIAHTFGQGVPPNLFDSEAEPFAPEDEFTVEPLEDTEEGLIWEAAVPILQGQLGMVRVGMSERHLQSEIRDTTAFLLLATGLVSLVGVAAAYLLTSVLTRPVRNLVMVTEAVAKGDLHQKATVWAKDEVGRLGVAFNAMTDALAASKREIEEFSTVDSCGATRSFRAERHRADGQPLSRLGRDHRRCVAEGVGGGQGQSRLGLPPGS